MSCKIKRDSNNEITAVYAPNGKPSILYNSLKDFVNNDKEKALSIWARAYSPNFLYRYGNWLSNIDDNPESLTSLPNQTPNLDTDENGEPAIKYLSLPEIIYPNIPNTEEKIKTFLNSIGVSLEIVQDLLPKDISGQADFLNHVIHISKDNQTVTTLPEEAAHFFVRLLPAKSSLRSDLFNQITSYPV